MDDPLLGIALLIMLPFFGVASAVAAHARGHHPALGFLFGMFLGPIGFLVAITLPRDMPATPPLRPATEEGLARERDLIIQRRRKSRRIRREALESEAHRRRHAIIMFATAHWWVWQLLVALGMIVAAISLLRRSP